MKQIQLWHLSPGKFEQLCYRYLWHKKKIVFESFGVGGDRSGGVDFDATIIGKGVFHGIIKHRYRLNVSELFGLINSINDIEKKNILLFTSAIIQQPQIAKIIEYGRANNIAIEIVQYNDFVEFSQNYYNDLKKEFPELYKGKNYIISKYLVLMAIALIGIYIISNQFNNIEHENEYQKELRLLDQSIGALMNLEKYLAEKRKDIVETNKKHLEIKKSLEQSEQLLALKDEQINLIIERTSKESTIKTILMNLLSGIIGVITSLIASAIWDKHKLNKLLNEKTNA